MVISGTSSYILAIVSRNLILGADPAEFFWYGEGGAIVAKTV